jgi:hypothetical protein
MMKQFPSYTKVNRLRLHAETIRLLCSGSTPPDDEDSSTDPDTKQRRSEGCKTPACPKPV